jgi:hypothetical protein
LVAGDFYPLLQEPPVDHSALQRALRALPLRAEGLAYFFGEFSSAVLGSSHRTKITRECLHSNLRFPRRRALGNWCINLCLDQHPHSPESEARQGCLSVYPSGCLWTGAKQFGKGYAVTKTVSALRAGAGSSSKLGYFPDKSIEKAASISL